MFCAHCGKEIDDNLNFCDYCGKSTAEDSGSSSAPTDIKNKSGTPEELPTTVKTVRHTGCMIAAILIPVVLVVIGIVISEVLDNNYQKKKNEAIEAVQEAYFEFLPEMTVGEIITEYYGEDYWACNVDDVVEFWGTNQKDKSGLALHFSSVKSDNTVEATYIMYHEENEIAHDISEEEFESYILSLYSSYKGIDSSDKAAVTTENITVQMTKPTTTKAEKTNSEKQQEEMGKSQYYAVYLMTLRELDTFIKAEYSDSYLPYYRYYLYDINHDDFYELLIHLGESEADAGIMIYTIDEGSEDGLTELGEIGGGHTILTEKDGNLYSNYGHGGYQIVEEIQMVGWHDVWSVTQETVLEQDGLSEYVDYGTAINGYDISDTSAVEALCPKELLEDKPYVDGYVETYSLSGHDGSKIRLYLDGDFSSVSVLIHNDEYTSDPEYYSKEDFNEYIEISFNPFAQPPSVVYVTPYSDSCIPGATIICDIPTDASGTIQTGGMSYPIQDKKGQINCHGETVAGFTTDYVVNGGAVEKVRSSLGDTWHVTAKNACDNYGVTWYELWDSDDGDYYGWVDSNYIDFY